MNVMDLCDGEKTIIWIHGAMLQLTKWGLATGEGYGILAKGVALFDQLDAQWKPSDEFLSIGIDTMDDAFSPEHKDIFMTLLKTYRDDRVRMEERARIINDAGL
jgi:hypothetical protein